MAIHPLSYRAASLSDVDGITLRLCAGDKVDNRGRLAGVVPSDRNAPIGAVRECRDSVHTLARLAARSVTRECAIRLWRPRFPALLCRRRDEQVA